MTIKNQAYLQGYMHEKTAAVGLAPNKPIPPNIQKHMGPWTGDTFAGEQRADTARRLRAYDTQDFGRAAQLNAAAKEIPGGLLQGLKNIGRGARGLVETAAGGIGTAGSEVLGEVEDFSDAKGWTDDDTNTWRDTADKMFEFTRAGARNVGDVFGAAGGPGLFGERGDHVTKLHNQVMDESGRNSAKDKLIAQGALGTGRLMADGVGYIGGLGTASTRVSRVLLVLPGLQRARLVFQRPWLGLEEVVLPSPLN